MPGGGEDIENLTTGLAKLQTTSEETTSEGRGDEQPYRLDAYKFIYNVKARFEGNIDVFYSFLNNLLMWESGSKTMAQICHESTILFREHPDLLLEFAPFLAGFSQESLVRDAGMSMLLQPLNI